VEVVISAKLPDISCPQFHLLLLGALTWWHAWRHLVAKVGTSNQDRTISLKAAVRSCINKQMSYTMDFFWCWLSFLECFISWRAFETLGSVHPVTQYHVPENLNVTAAQEMLFKKFMKPAWSDEELQKLIETRDTVNTVPPTGVNKRTKY